MSNKQWLTYVRFSWLAGNRLIDCLQASANEGQTLVAGVIYGDLNRALFEAELRQGQKS